MHLLPKVGVYSFFKTQLRCSFLWKLSSTKLPLFLCARGYSLACSTSKQFTDHFYHISQTCLCQFLTFFCCGHLWQFGNAFEVIHSCSELCFKNILKIIMETDNTGMQSVPYTSLVPRTTYLVCLHVRHSIFRSPESSADVAHLYFFFY